jgi:hypothetical protein
VTGVGIARGAVPPDNPARQWHRSADRWHPTSMPNRDTAHMESSVVGLVGPLLHFFEINPLEHLGMTRLELTDDGVSNGESPSHERSARRHDASHLPT